MKNMVINGTSESREHCLQNKLHPNESKIEEKNNLTDSLLMLLSRVFHHSYKIPVVSASTPTTDQLEPAPEPSYQAVYVLIW